MQITQRLPKERTAEYKRLHADRQPAYRAAQRKMKLGREPERRDAQLLHRGLGWGVGEEDGEAEKTLTPLLARFSLQPHSGPHVLLF